MKTYLLDTYNRYKRYSETLDVKTKLCNRPWVVFNDGGEREVYKFKEDGTIKIILSGRVTTGTWEYDPSDKTLEIAAGDQAFMVHPGLYEDMLLGLQLDGTNQCAFLIEENNAQKFEPKTYTELIGYFEQKEQALLETENTAKREAARQQQQRETEERTIHAFEEFLKKERFQESVKSFRRGIIVIPLVIGIIFFFCCYFFMANSLGIKTEDDTIAVSSISFLLATTLSIICLIIMDKKACWKYKKLVHKLYARYINSHQWEDVDEKLLWNYCEKLINEKSSVL